MLYVQQSLSSDEDLIYVARFHWFYDVQAILSIVWGLFFSLSLLISVQVLIGYLPVKAASLLLSAPLYVDDGWLDVIRKMHPIIKIVAMFVFLIGVWRFAHLMIIKATTEIVVTSNRIIFKRGLIARNVGEMSIDRIESVSVHQSFWGRLFDFGRLIIHGMGVGEMIMPNLAEPIRFRKAIEKARNG